MIQQENSKLRYKNRKIYAPPPKEDYSTNFKKLIAVIIISFIFIAGEFVGGIISGSISVISDAFHLVTDLLGFTVSFFFIWFSRKKPNQIITFGYHRMELMGALGNLFIIWALAIFLIYQATLRIINKEFVKQPLAMLIVAAAGLPINIIMYFVLHSGGSHSHGLMSQSCGEQFPLQQINSKSGKIGQSCSATLCEDVQCLISNEYEDHCHTQEGDNQLIHKHKIKVLVEGDKIIRKSSKDILGGAAKLEQGKMAKEKHVHGQGCENSHDHDHDHQHGDQHEHEHEHQHEHSNCKMDDHKHNHGFKEQNNNKLTQQYQKNKLEGNQNKKKMKKNKKNKKNAGGSQNQIHPENGHQDNHNHGHENQKKHKHGHEHGHEHGDQCNHGHEDGHGNYHSGHDHSGHNHDHGHSHESMSMKAAVLHALSDVIQSIGLLISSLVIFFVGSNMGHQVTQWNDWHFLDPISTYVFSVIVIFSTVPIAKNCYQIIMQSVPAHLKYQQIHDEIAHVEGVIDVHDLHIWDLRPGKTILTAHVFSKIGQERNVLKRLTDLSRMNKIYHSTFQIQQQQWKDHMEYILCDHDIH